MSEIVLTPNGEKVLRKVLNYFRLEIEYFSDTFQNGKEHDRASAVVAVRDELLAIEYFLSVLNGMKDINADERLYIRKKLYIEFYKFMQQYIR